MRKRNKITDLLESVNVPIVSAFLCEVILLLGLGCDIMYEANVGNSTYLYFAMFASMLIVFFMLILTAVFQRHRSRSKKSISKESNRKEDQPNWNETKEKKESCILLIVWIVIVATMVVRITLKFI